MPYLTTFELFNSLEYKRCPNLQMHGFRQYIEKSLDTNAKFTVLYVLSIAGSGS